MIAGNHDDGYTGIVAKLDGIADALPRGVFEPGDAE